MRKALVGLWSQRPTTKTHNSYETTVSLLDQAALRTHLMAKRRGLAPAAGKLKSILIAPEFLFTLSDNRSGNTATAMTKNTRDSLLAAIGSACRPSMLLIPGTVVFKEVLSLDTIRKAKDNLEQAKNPAAIAGQAGYPVKTPAWKKTPPTLDPYVTKEHLDDFGNLGPKAGSQAYYDGQIAELTGIEKNMVAMQPVVLRRSFLIKNRTYVFFDKKRIFSFGKKCNMDDFHDDTSKGIFVPGKKAAITQIDGLKVGFEICMDHDAGVLKILMGTTRDLDLQIICSAEVPNNVGNCVTKVGGYTLHGSTNPKFSQVNKKAKVAGWEEIKPPPDLAPVLVGDGPLWFYEIDLPD
jgi:hypothetical protein